MQNLKPGSKKSNELLQVSGNKSDEKIEKDIIFENNTLTNLLDLGKDVVNNEPNSIEEVKNNKDLFFTRDSFLQQNETTKLPKTSYMTRTQDPQSSQEKKSKIDENISHDQSQLAKIHNSSHKKNISHVISPLFSPHDSMDQNFESTCGLYPNQNKGYFNLTKNYVVLNKEKRYERERKRLKQTISSLRLKNIHNKQTPLNYHTVFDDPLFPKQEKSKIPGDDSKFHKINFNKKSFSQINLKNNISK